MILHHDIRVVTIQIGGVEASSEPMVVRTVLGSCISVCLFDSLMQIGGMNHFMLPTGSEGDLSTRYGINAMELLINGCMKLGADRRRLAAKVFGGGHVLKTRRSDDSVPMVNIRFALQFLNVEGIPIISQDVGGTTPREVYFYTHSGRVRMRRMLSTDPLRRKAQLQEIRGRQLANQLRLPTDDSNITLF